MIFDCSIYFFLIVGMCVLCPSNWLERFKLPGVVTVLSAAVGSDDANDWVKWFWSLKAPQVTVSFSKLPRCDFFGGTINLVPIFMGTRLEFIELTFCHGVFLTTTTFHHC